MSGYYKCEIISLYEILKSTFVLGLYLIKYSYKVLSTINAIN